VSWYAKGKPNANRGLKILNAAWGPLDPRLLTWLDNYTSVLRAAGEYTEAGRIELQATHIGFSKRAVAQVEKCALLAPRQPRLGLP
jgi:hypothetical protein